MKAYVLHDIDCLKMEDISLPFVPEDWVLVEVKAVGICGSDIPRIFKTGAHRHPLVPGHEFSGRVLTGEDVSNVQRRWAGKRVGVFPLIPCGKCDCCKQKKYEMCSNYNYLGSRCDGAFAQYVAVPEWNLLPLPDSVSYETAAMLEPMAVAAHALRAAAPKEDEVAAVCGLGTIGLLMVMLLKQAGVKRILAIGNKDFQKDCIKLISDSEPGKDDNCRRSENRVSEKCCIEFADRRTTDIETWVLSRTGGQGAALFFECVGKNETLLQAIRCTKPGGRIELVGNPASDMVLDRDTYWKILRKQLTLRGTWNSSYWGETSLPARNKDAADRTQEDIPTAFAGTNVAGLEQDIGQQKNVNAFTGNSTSEYIDDWHYVLKILPDIRPQLLITHRLPLEELEKGLHIMRDKTEDFVKVMILP